MTIAEQAMENPLHILLLEDDPADAELIAQELKSSGLVFDLTRIQSEPALRRELAAGTANLILSDHGLPAFDGFKALQIVRATHPVLPFIFVSGSNDQGMVARMYEEGATDYVFKHDLGDLRTSVKRAMESPSSPAPALLPPEPAPDVPGFARLRYCPACAQARDESGDLVDFEDYFSRHAETVVLKEHCAGCRSSGTPG